LPVALGAAAPVGARIARDLPVELAPQAAGEATSGAVARDARSSDGRVAVTLAPAAVGDDGRIPSLDVTLTLDDVRAAAGEPLLCLPLVTDNVDTVAATLSIAEAHDAEGPFALAAHDREPDEGEPARCWSAERPLAGEVVVRYSAPVLNATGTRGAAPPIELRSEAGAVSGGGATFLMMPPGDTPRRFAVSFDLSALPAGARALSSYGAGDVAIDEALPPGRFTDAYFMAGAIGRYPHTGETEGFFGAWQGQPPFDAPPLMQRGEELYASYLEFFRPPDHPPFGVFLRENPVNPGGGMGLQHSFILTFGPETDAAGLNGTLAHEMFHVFVGSLDAPAGLQSSWFGEGLAVHYERLMLLRTGQITPGQFLDSVNATAARYYTNALIDTPNDEIPARFWEDTRVRVLPYDRGSLYFAALDHRLRSLSSRRRSLDDLLLAMLELRRSGRPMDRAAWVHLLDRELDSVGVAEFEAMLAGEVVLPPPDAFGPCFTRTQKPLRRYQLGFEPKVLTENPRIVRGLIADSAAARAGLENGDEILRPVPQDAIQGDQDAWLSLAVRRGERTFTVRYQPRGETVNAWQWERRDAVPDAGCAF
jgi:predicted metalloprotease with PDZ domain